MSQMITIDSNSDLEMYAVEADDSRSHNRLKFCRVSLKRTTLICSTTPVFHRGNRVCLNYDTELSVVYY